MELLTCQPRLIPDLDRTPWRPLPKISALAVTLPQPPPFSTPSKPSVSSLVLASSNQSHKSKAISSSPSSSALSLPPLAIIARTLGPPLTPFHLWTIRTARTTVNMEARPFSLALSYHARCLTNYYLVGSKRQLTILLFYHRPGTPKH
jgi:hypothetical protein